VSSILSITTTHMAWSWHISWSNSNSIWIQNIQALTSLDSHFLSSAHFNSSTVSWVVDSHIAYLPFNEWICPLTLEFYQLKIPDYCPILNLLKHLRVHDDWFAQRFSLYNILYLLQIIASMPWIISENSKRKN
jgi:hypothetical protein